MGLVGRNQFLMPTAIFMAIVEGKFINSQNGFRGGSGKYVVEKSYVINIDSL